MALMEGIRQRYPGRTVVWSEPGDGDAIVASAGGDHDGLGESVESAH